jgi:hypothetical protein
MIRIRLGWCSGLVAAWLLGTCTGCSTLPLFHSASNDVPAAPSHGTVTVEVRESGEQGKAHEMELRGLTHVQDAVAFSKAQRKFGRLFVTLYRQNPQGQWHKMDCRYEIAKKRISPEFDYALQPGDRVVIEEDQSTLIDDMLQTATSPLGSLRR